MKMTPWFTRLQATLGVYDILLSGESELYKKKCPGSSKLYNGSEWLFVFEVHKSAYLKLYQLK